MSRKPDPWAIYPRVARGFDYANRVLTGERSASRLVVAACERFKRDLERQDTDGFPYHWDPDEAERWLDFLARLRHVKGSLAGQEFEPEDWQCFIVLNVYGWLDEDDRRRFLTVFVEVPRGNGKSFFVGALGVGHMTIDGDIGAEVYCGATSEKQAGEVFLPARGMCLNNAPLCQDYGIEVSPKARSLYVLDTGSKFERLIGDPGDGAAPSCAIVDEYHEHRTDDLLETMQRGMSKRAQPLLWIITTAGSDLGSPCYDMHLDIAKLLEQQYEDETTFGLIYGIDLEDEEKGLDGDRWDTVEALVKANPNWHASINQRVVLAELDEARRNPRKQASYKTKHLDIWVGARVAWMNMLKFQACGRRGITPEQFADWDLFVGLDLASKIDLASMCLLFRSPDESRWAAFFRRWLPEARLEGALGQEASQNERRRLTKEAERYLGYYEAGLLETTPGDVIDLDRIEDAIVELRGRFNVREVGYDPFQATQLATHMIAEGFEMVEVPATPKQYTEPMTELEAVIYSRNFEYDAADKALVWMMGNTVALRGRTEATFPTKERASAKIDDVIALINAMNRAIGSDDDSHLFDGRELG